MVTSLNWSSSPGGCWSRWTGPARFSRPSSWSSLSAPGTETASGSRTIRTGEPLPEQDPWASLGLLLLHLTSTVSPIRLFSKQEIQQLRSVTFHDVLVAVTSARASDLQRDVFFWRDGSCVGEGWGLHSHMMKRKLKVGSPGASGDPCAQPAQLNPSMLQPCTNATQLHYFDGSKAGFGIFIVVLFLFPVGQYENNSANMSHRRLCCKMLSLVLLPQSACWWPTWWRVSGNTDTGSFRGGGKQESGVKGQLWGSAVRILQH